jgi:hypothetical protein
MFTWSTEASAESHATPRAVWNLWSSPSTWSEWDEGVEHCTLEGPFAVGSRGTLKATGGPAARFRLTEVEPELGFADVTKLPLTTLEFRHTVEPLPAGGVCIRHHVRMRGLLAPLWSRILGKSLETGLPETVRSLARRAESRAGVEA